jgi:hypothetical protein
MNQAHPKWEKHMKLSILHCERHTITATLGLLALAAAAQANAVCTDVMKHSVPTTRWNHPGFVPAVYQADDSDTAPDRNGDFREHASIVGLWEFKFSGFLHDFGTQTFQVGGTETMFSAGIDPATGDVCQGVWRKVGHSTYTLNHIAMGRTAPGAQYGLFIHFHMLIKVAPSGDSYKGTYKVSLYSSTPQDPFDESMGPFESGTGTVTASRVRPD